MSHQPNLGIPGQEFIQPLVTNHWSAVNQLVFTKRVHTWGDNALVAFTNQATTFGTVTAKTADGQVLNRCWWVINLIIPKAQQSISVETGTGCVARISSFQTMEVDMETWANKNIGRLWNLWSGITFWCKQNPLWELTNQPTNPKTTDYFGSNPYNRVV